MSDENRTTTLGWGDDQLSTFLQRVRVNQLATFTTMNPAFNILSEIDTCFVHVAESTAKSQTAARLSLVFFARCHAAYRAACGTSMAGQLPETFVLLRSCLEYSGYALLIHRKRDLEMIWICRHSGGDARLSMRRAFSASEAKNAVQSTDPGLGDWYSDLYESAIDFGAHPNPKGITPIIRSTDDSFSQIDLHGDGLFLRHGLDATARVGICSLYVFHNILPERFDLPICKKINELQRTGHL
jgi:hypothetical protein